MDSLVYVFGAGRAARLMLKRLERENIDVEGVCVTDAANNVKKIEKYPVEPIESIYEKKNRVCIYIAVLERGEKKIEKELRNKGFAKVIPFDEKILAEDELIVHRKQNPIIEVTPQIGCSVNCLYCPQKVLLDAYFKDDPNRKRIMEVSEYCIYLDHLPKNCIIDFSGFVEPFLNPDSIEMMEYTSSVKREMTLFTTLRGLTLQQCVRLPNMLFSNVVLHVADKDGFSDIPVTEEYLEMLGYVINARRADGTPFVDSANCQSEPHEKVLEVTSGKLRIYCEMQDRAGNLKNEERKLSSGNHKGKIYCDRAVNTDHFVLLPDGTVVLCCNDYGMQHVLGNLRDQTYEEIIQAESFLDVKRAMNTDESLPLLCRKCMYAKPKNYRNPIEVTNYKQSSTF